MQEVEGQSDLFNEMVPDWALTGIAQTAHATKAQKSCLFTFCG
jgi:hypothetical protein